MVCKILTNGAMGLKLGKVVYRITQHLHTKFEISTSFLSQNIPVEMIFLRKNGQICTLFWSVKYSQMVLWSETWQGCIP